ncbi:MAG: cohesin domain-containing protein [bacterium]
MKKTNFKIALLFCLGGLGLPFLTSAANLYFLPSFQDFYQGESLIVELRLNTEGEEINALETKIMFPVEILEVVDTNLGGSVLTIWPKEPTFSNSSGEISFIGGMPKGFSGDGLLAKIIFRAKSIGSANLKFTENSQALLNDGNGTKVDLVFLEGVYDILAKPEGLPIVFSSTHPDETKWFHSSTIHLHWDLAEETEYSFVLSHDPSVEPDDLPDKPERWVGDIEYPGLEDGIYYFFLKQRVVGGKWTEKTSLRIMIDATPPEPFIPKIGKEKSVYEGKYFLSFSAEDKASGVDYYEVYESKKELFKKESSSGWKKVKSPYVLENQLLNGVIKVRAVDKAGNERIVEVVLPAKPFPYKTAGIIIFLLLILIVIIARRKVKKTVKLE